MNYYLNELILPIIALIIGIILVTIFGILVGPDDVSGQEWTYDDCIQEFDPFTCEQMFPSIPLQTVNWSVPFP